MTSPARSTAERLLDAESPRAPYGWEQKDGYYVATCGISMNDVPDLIDIANKWCDPDWSGEDLELDANLEDIGFLPITAWRALADLKSSEAVEPLIEMLYEIEDDLDDWVTNELPHVFGKIGRSAIEALVRLAQDNERHDHLREIAADALRRVADYHPATRDEVVAYLTEMMAKATQDSITFNSTLLVGLVDLHATDAAEVIERAFADDLLDIAWIGDWEAIRRKLGVEGLGLKMSDHPHDTLGRFCTEVGIGIFSEQPVFEDGECLSDAVEAYHERARDLFSKSDEARQIVDRFGELGWFQTFLEFGLNYGGEIVDGMTVQSVQEFLLDYAPRKISVQPERAASMVSELTMFWKFVDRVYELPNAGSIVEWLTTDGLTTDLEELLSDSTNFGIAKSMVMSGTDAGFDMTSEEGIAKFMSAYNQSSRPGTSSAPTTTAPTTTAPTTTVSTTTVSTTTVSTTTVSGRQKIGRNDPCPCGSGKKFKKCCRREASR